MEKVGEFDSDRGYKSFKIQSGTPWAYQSKLLKNLPRSASITGEVEERFHPRDGPRAVQKINKTSSTVWLRHRPSGVEVRCQRERSQSANRELAWAELCARSWQRPAGERPRQGGGPATHVREAARRRVRQKAPGSKGS
jgi:peptide chain release factor